MQPGPPQAAAKQPLGDLPPCTKRCQSLLCSVATGLLFQRKRFSPIPASLSQFSVTHPFKDALWGSLSGKPQEPTRLDPAKQLMQLSTPCYTLQMHTSGTVQAPKGICCVCNNYSQSPKDLSGSVDFYRHWKKKTPLQTKPDFLLFKLIRTSSEELK